MTPSPKNDFTLFIEGILTEQTLVLSRLVDVPEARARALCESLGQLCEGLRFSCESSGPRCFVVMVRREASHG